MNSTKTKRITLLGILVASQLAMLFALSVLDYAYIFPSQSGLSLETYTLLGVIYSVVLLVGMSIAISQKRLMYIGLQIGNPVACVVLVYASSFFDPRRQTLDPSDYQHLIGKTRGEVEPLLSKFGRYGGAKGVDGDGIETVFYNGIELRYERARLKNKYDESGDILKEVVKGASR